MQRSKVVKTKKSVMKKKGKTDCDDTLVVYSGNGIELTTAVNETLLDTEEGELRRNINNLYPKKITCKCSKIKNK